MITTIRGILKHKRLAWISRTSIANYFWVKVMVKHSGVWTMITHCSCRSRRLFSALCRLSRSFIILEMCSFDALFCTWANQQPPKPITTDTKSSRSFSQLCGGPGDKNGGIQRDKIPANWIVSQLNCFSNLVQYYDLTKFLFLAIAYLTWPSIYLITSRGKWG